MYGQVGRTRETIVDNQPCIIEEESEAFDSGYQNQETDYELSPDTGENLTPAEFEDVRLLLSSMPHVEQHVRPRENLSDTMTFAENRLWELNHIDPGETEEVYPDTPFRQHLTTFADEDDEEVYV